MVEVIAYHNDMRVVGGSEIQTLEDMGEVASALFRA